MRIHGYHLKPAIQFKGSDDRNALVNDEDKYYLRKPLYLGFELEVECDNNYRNTVADALDLVSGVSGEDDFHLENDGSLRNGFEIVSQPRTLTSHQNFSVWQDVTTALSRMGCKSHDTRTCGLHIHFNRDCFGPRDEVKFMFWIYSQHNLLRAVTRRDPNNFCKTKSPHECKKHKKTPRGDRYTAVNDTPRHTIEVRAFRGTLKHSTLMACLEFVTASIIFSNTVSPATLADPTKSLKMFLGFLSGNGRVATTYRHLIALLKDKGYQIPENRVRWKSESYINS